MVYNSVSIENIIGRVIRNTKLMDSSAQMDLYEWIPEAMELMETQYQMYPDWKELDIKFHQAKLPCGLVVLDAVEYNGKRLMYANTSRHAAAPKEIKLERSTVFNSVLVPKLNPATDNITVGSTLEDAQKQPIDSSNSYYTKLNYLCTSMKEAKVFIFFRTPPLDSNGFPLIPDNGNYKEALYWWSRGKLIASGSIEPTREISESSCLERFERYAARAIGEITYPTVDRMERIRANQAHFIVPEGYWENYHEL